MTFLAKRAQSRFLKVPCTNFLSTTKDAPSALDIEIKDKILSLMFLRRVIVDILPFETKAKTPIWAHMDL